MNLKQQRERMKFILSRLSDAEHRTFRLMYHRFNDIAPIDEVVDSLPDEKVPRALKQCEGSYHKIFRILAGKI